MPLNIAKQKSVEARLIERAPGHCLVANFRESSPPVLWQLGLGGGRSAAVTLRGRDDTWTLGLVEPNGELTPVARFDTEEDAEDAYAAVQKAMMKGRSCRGHALVRWVISIIVALIILFGLQILPSLLMGTDKTPDLKLGADSKLGVPLPADEVLSRQP